MTIYYVPQYKSTTLSVAGGIDNSQTSGIVLADITGIDDTKPGIVCINWSDPLDTDISEYVTYTSINSGTKELNGVTRGAEGVSAKAHNNSVSCAFILSKSHINNIADIINAEDPFPNGIDSSDDINLATGKQLQVNNTDPKRIISLSAGAWTGTETSGAESGSAETTTNAINYKYMAFDTSSDESAFVEFPMPLAWDAGTLEFRVIWTCATGDGGAAETVAFNLAGIAFADGDALDTAVGTAQTVTDTWQADEDEHKTDWSSALTLAGTPAAGESIYLQLTRDVSEDDLGGDALVKSVQIRYTESLATDA